MKFLRACLSGRHDERTKNSAQTQQQSPQCRQQQPPTRVKRHSKVHQSAVTCLARHWERNTVVTGGADGTYCGIYYSI